MPADYESTARALALPVTEPNEDDEPESPSPLFDAVRTQPPWNHRHRRRSSQLSTEEIVGLRDRTINAARSAYRRMAARYAKMTLKQKVVYLLSSLVLGVLGLMFMALTGQIFVWLAPVADRWERAPWAYIVVWLLVFGVSFPPLVGWSTLGTVSGYLFGLWKGWLVYATATVAGSTCSFIVSRTVLSNFAHRLLERDKRFAALSLVLKYDGLKLLCMIRLCPLPYSVCNGAVSTFPTVSPLNYGLATALISPKLLVAAFIGSRLRVLSGKEEEMSAAEKAVNIISIIVSICIGVGTGIYIYRRTLARARQLEAEERAGIRRSIHEDHAAGHHRHGRFSDDPNANTAAKTLARDEEDELGLNDMDEDNVDLVLDGDDGVPRPYRDDFTDNESDVFRDGDGDDTDVIGLRTQVRS